MKRQKWLLEKLKTAQEPGRAGQHSHHPEAWRCQGWNVGSYFAGHPCGNEAKYEIGPEKACHTHVAQAISRNPGASAIDINDNLS